MFTLPPRLETFVPRSRNLNPEPLKFPDQNRRQRHRLGNLVSGGGISADGTTWHPARQKFLLPIKALAKLVRGKFRALLRQKCPHLVVPDAAWHKPWILHVSARGNGEQAVLDYLARYVFRVALTNARIVGLDDQSVTIQYKDRKSGRRRTCRLSGEEFTRRFLQHVLPCGFHKVRYFGLWHPAQRHNAARVRQMLQLQAPPKLDPLQDPIVPPLVPPDAEPVPPIEPMICPHCHQGPMTAKQSVLAI